MATEKQIAANRANARKSKGPVTPEGKAKASRNSAEKGLLQKALTLQCERASTFQTFENRFQARFRPEGPVELMLVEVLIASAWRLFRAWHVERAGIDYELRRQASSGAEPAILSLDHTTRTYLAIRSIGNGRNPLDYLQRVEARLDRQFHQALERLGALRREAGRPDTCDLDGLVPPGYSSPRYEPNFGS